MSSSWDDLLDSTIEDVSSAKAVMEDGRKRAEMRRLSPKERAERKRQAARTRLNLDVPDWLKVEVQHIADVEQVSTSTLAAYFCCVGLREYRARRLDLPKEHCESPRFEWLVMLPEDLSEL